MDVNIGNANILVYCKAMFMGFLKFIAVVMILCQPKTQSMKVYEWKGYDYYDIRKIQAVGKQ